MKYVIIAALVSIIFVLVYSRIRPYLKLIQELTNFQSRNRAGAAAFEQLKGAKKSRETETFFAVNHPEPHFLGDKIEPAPPAGNVQAARNQ